MLTRAVPELRTRIVKADRLEQEVGHVATRISPSERQRMLSRRRTANMRRYPN
jgi:hypothetical protein